MRTSLSAPQCPRTTTCRQPSSKLLRPIAASALAFACWLAIACCLVASCCFASPALAEERTLQSSDPEAPLAYLLDAERAASLPLTAPELDCMTAEEIEAAEAADADADAQEATVEAAEAEVAIAPADGQIASLFADATNATADKAITLYGMSSDYEKHSPCPPRCARATPCPAAPPGASSAATP